jgi:hypothetical protein
VIGVKVAAGSSTTDALLVDPVELAATRNAAAAGDAASVVVVLLNLISTFDVGLKLVSTPRTAGCTSGIGASPAQH